MEVSDVSDDVRAAHARTHAPTHAPPPPPPPPHTHTHGHTRTRRGTGNNAAVQKLLHFAVSDVSDDVRRGAVMCLGFVLMGVPEQCPRIVSLLAESFSPHVRCA